MNNNTPLLGIDKIYVLSVKSFKDRIESISQQLSEHRISFEFIFDYDIPDITEEDLTLFGPSNLELPHKSLVLKNIAVWKRLCRDNIRRALILEDDAILHENFRAELEKLNPAIEELKPGHLIFLGGADMRIDKQFINYPNPLVPRPIETAEGFIIDSASARLRLEWLEKNKITLPADGLMRAIDKDLDIKQFWPKTPLAEQGSVTGQFTTTLDGSRKKHGSTYLSLKYQWDKLRKRTIQQWLTNLGGSK